MTSRERAKFTNMCRRIIGEKDRGKRLALYQELQRFFDTAPLATVTSTTASGDRILGEPSVGLSRRAAGFDSGAQ